MKTNNNTTPQESGKALHQTLKKPQIKLNKSQKKKIT